MKINKKHILLFILIFAGMLIFATGTCSAVGKVWATKDRNIWTYDNGWHYTNTINYHNSVKRVQYKKYIFNKNLKK